MNPIRVLLIDDDQDDFLITRDLFDEMKGKWKYRLDWISSYEEAKKAMQSQQHDVYLVDYHLGVESGLDLIHEMRKASINAPFILLTGQGDSKTDERAMLAGATDFLVKSALSSGELERTIRYGIQHMKTMHEIRQLNAGLEKRVEERTAELEKTVRTLEETNEVLKEAIHEREKAEKRMGEALEREKMLNDLKSRFITMASHEFRTPLGTILSSIHLISQYKHDHQLANREKHVQRIKSSVAHLTDLLNDFLSLEKLEAGKILTTPEDFNFRELITETVQEMQDIARQGQKIVYEHSQEGGPANVTLDKRHVKGILINLLSNAIKYSGENSAISVYTTSLPDKQVMQVCDQGIGIPPDEHAHLFERFFRAKNAVNIQGTGLGLNIIKKYLNLMGGSISFKSEPGSGSTFSVTLPNRVALK